MWRHSVNIPSSIYLIPGSLRSDPRFNLSPIRHYITCCFHLGGRVNSVQGFPYGRGKWLLKYAVRLLLAAKNFLFLKARETSSAMSLSSPDILIGGIFYACVSCMRMPMKRRRRSSVREEPNLGLIVHPTAEVLSQNRSTWVWVRLYVMRSSAIQFRTSPFSLRYFILRLAALNSYFNFCVHYNCQMIGLIFLGHMSRLPPCRLHRYLSIRCSLEICSPAGGHE